VTRSSTRETAIRPLLDGGAAAIARPSEATACEVLLSECGFLACVARNLTILFCQPLMTGMGALPPPSVLAISMIVFR
jgi:hypothetical protein